MSDNKEDQNTGKYILKKKFQIKKLNQFYGD
jgi:hypothetical protein